MKRNKEKGLAGIDIVIAIIAIMIFSTLIISMIYNNLVENVKLKKGTLAMIYLTEIFENVAIEKYENVTQSNIGNFIPEQMKDIFQVEILVATDFEGITNAENIMKKVTVKLSYQIDDKTYNCSMERIKIKE